MHVVILRSTNSDSLVSQNVLGKMVVAMTLIAAACFVVGVTVGGGGNFAGHNHSAQNVTHEPVYGRYGRFIR